ncbi:DUF86 domain-containing protein [Candidatus Woesearchaeota archaeon]|nr:DUF86 domain-containing protein [Candidatus Woesearchaeota archaeon]
MDRERILSLLDALGQYLKELQQRIPEKFSSYQGNIEKRRFCERTLQLAIEACIDTCQLLVKDLKLGLPTEEESLFDKLENEKILSKLTALKLKEMKKFRNVLIHKYVEIENHIVYENSVHRLGDFEKFKKEVLTFLKADKKRNK